jgi:hypothetical protein
MRRTLTLSSVAACLVFAAAAVVALEPWSRSRPSPCAFEIQVESDRSGLVQVYYDIGRGINEPDSVLLPIAAGRRALLRFPLPYGRYQALRFDPLDRDATVTVSGARIADGSGRSLAAFSPGQFKTEAEIASLRIAGASLVIVTAPLATDPRMRISLDGPVTIARPSLWAELAEIFAAAVGLLAVVAWARVSPLVRLDERARGAWGAACRRPSGALAVAALAGTLAANYPVVFAGRSFVSPNLGIALLYGQNPWLPGFQSSEAGDPHKADVAAVMWQHLPLSMIERRALLKDGELPLWNRYDSAGLPLLGQGQSSFGDPLNFLPILADGASWAWDLKFVLAKWAFALGVGLCAWRAFRHLPTALLTAASAAFIGFFLYRINHPAVFSVCYSPWILYCWLCRLEARSRRGALLCLLALVGANWCEMNSGTAKEAYVLLLSMNFSGLCVLLLADRPWREKAALLAGFAAAGGVFALLGSPVWYTFYRELRASYTSYNAPLAFQIQPGMAIGLFDEIFYRPFQFESGVVNPSANFFILAGLLWALVRWRALLACRPSLALLLSVLPALALAFGVVSPGLVARVPFLGNILHVDNTFSCVLVVVLAILSAFGWREAWMRLGGVDGKRESALVVGLVLVLFAVYLGTAQTVVRSAYADATWGRIIRVEPFIHLYAWSLIVAVGALLWALRRALQRGAPTAAALVVAAVALGALHWRLGLKLGGAYSDYSVRPTRRVDLQAPSPAVGAVLARSDAPLRVVGFHNDLLPGWSIVYGLEGISGPDALMNPYYRELMDAAGVNRVWDWRYIVEPAEAAKLKWILDALNVRFYLGYHLGGQRPGRELTQVAASDMDVFESTSAWPRAFFTDSVAVYNDVGQYCSWLKAGDGRPFAGIAHGDWVGLSPVPRVSGDLGTRHVRAAENYRLTTDTTSFTVDASGPGFIVLTEAYEKGNFQATVNGRPVPYIRVNHAFKGIYVDGAGTYEVRFSYWPRGFTATLALFGLGLLLLLAGLLWALLADGGPGGRVGRAAEGPGPAPG